VIRARWAVIDGQGGKPAIHATTEDQNVLLRDEGGTDVRSIDVDQMAANINRFAPGPTAGRSPA
jgi:hypothetical protein